MKILLLPGDGIGPEVVGVAKKILAWFVAHRGLKVELQEALVGGAAIDAHGTSLPPAVLAQAKAADAVLLGAVGGPKWDKVAYDIRPEAALLALRKELDLFANLRPAIVFDALLEASTLKPEIVRGLNLMIVRELTSGVYFGTPRGIETLPDGTRRGINTHSYTSAEIRRVAAVAFELAVARGGRVLSAEKGNVMEAGRLWREEVTALHAEKYQHIHLSHMYADALAMQLLRTPTAYDVIVTDNLFGDILSDEAAMLTGSIGMLPSAALGPARADGSRPAMYEPVHGSAPDIAGQDKANPLATILSVAMLLRYSAGRGADADLLEQAVAATLAAGHRTADLAQKGEKTIGCTAMGQAVLDSLTQLTA